MSHTGSRIGQGDTIRTYVKAMKASMSFMDANSADLTVHVANMQADMMNMEAGMAVMLQILKGQYLSLPSCLTFILV